MFGPGKTGQLGAVEEGQSDQLATFQGNHMIVTADRSYLHSDTELSALDRARYLAMARERKALSTRQSEITKQLRKLGNAPAAAAERDRLKEDLAGIGREIDARTAAMESCILWKIPCRWPVSLVLAGKRWWQVVNPRWRHSRSRTASASGSSRWRVPSTASPRPKAPYT